MPNAKHHLCCLLAIAAAVALLPLAAYAQTCTTAWANPDDGSWTDDANWTNGAPGTATGGLSPCITIAGTYTVTIGRSDNMTISSLVIGGEGGLQTLSSSAQVTITGDAHVGANGHIAFQNRVPGGSDGLYMPTGTIRVEGVVTVPGGVSFLSTGGTLDLTPEGRLVLAAGAGAGGGTSLFRLSGTVEGACTSTCNIGAPIALDGGTIRLTAGRLDVRAGGTIRDLVLDTDAGTQMYFSTANDSKTFVVEGTISGSPAGLVYWAAGYAQDGHGIAAGPAGATLDLGGTGFQLVSTDLTSAGGTFTNTGLLLKAATGSNFAGLSGVELVNRGRIAFTSGLPLRSEAVIQNEPDGVLAFNGGGIGGVGNDGTGRLISRGLIVVEEGATGTSYIRVPVDIADSEIRVEAARFDVSEGGTLRDVTFGVAESATLILSGNRTDKRFVVEGTLSGDPAGTFYFSGVNLAAGPAGATMAIGGTGLQLSGSAFLASAGGEWTNTGLLVHASTGSNFASIEAATLHNEGHFHVGGNGFGFRAGGVVRNTPGGVVEFTTSGGMGGVGGTDGQFVNAGLLLKTGPTGTSRFTVELVSEPGAEYRVLGGRLDLPTPTTKSTPAGVLLTGTGGFFLPPDHGGTISPGTDAQPLATLTLQSRFMPSLTEGEPHLVIDVGANGESDLISGTAGAAIRLGGTLVVRVRPGYVPQVGDLFTIISRFVNATTITGSFDEVITEGAPEGISFVAEINGNTAVQIRAVATADLEATASETREDGDPVSFVVRASSTSGALDATTVAFELSGSASPFDDYVTDATGSTLQIPAGQTEATLTVYPRRDALAEDDETITLRIVGGDVTPGASAEATIMLHDGPSSDALAVTGTAPSRGANVGRVTATVLGHGLADGATVRLTRGGTIIKATDVEADDSGLGVRATFDLAEAAIGSYDVTVEQNGQSVTRTGAFTVEASQGIQVWADVVGTPNPRVGRWSTYTVFLGNSGNTDVHDVALVLRLTPGLEFEFMEGLQDFSDLPAKEQELVLPDVDQAQVIPLWFKKVPAGYTGSFRIRVRPVPPIGIGDGVWVSYELYPPDPENPFTWSGDFDDAVPFNYGLMWGALGAYLEAYPDDEGGKASTGNARAAGMRQAAVPLARAAAMEECPPNNNWNPRDQPPLIQDQSVDDLINEYSQGHRFNKYYSDAQSSTGPGGMSMSTMMSQATTPRIGAGGVLSGVMAMFTIRAAGKKSQQILSDRGWGGDGGANGGGNGGDGNGGGGDGNGGGGNGGDGGSSGVGGPGGGAGTGGAGGCAGGSRDPNDKLGPAGAGADRYITAKDPARYVIRFENMATATFPAQEVVIVDTLDADVFDLSTFSLGPITWGDQVITPPPGLQSFSTEVDLAPALPATLLINARLDAANGRAVWTFATLDPETRDLPEDGLIGFLPPNVEAPEGEGAVSFTVQPRAGLSTGTRIENRAEIVFDVNEPIVTPVWSNVVDVTAPATNVQALSATSAGVIDITVEGADAGAGIQSYGLFVSKDGAPFELYAVSAEPAFTFEGEVGATYGFFSAASDFTLNVEGPKTEAEATTTVVVSVEEGPDVPAVLTLSQPYPNPARGQVALRWGLPAPGTVDLRVYDLLGREVAHLLGSEMAAGWHVTPWAADVASGVYVIRLQTERGGWPETRTQRIVVIQ